jgi:hypothetical protein
MRAYGLFPRPAYRRLGEVDRELAGREREIARLLALRTCPRLSLLDEASVLRLRPEDRARHDEEDEGPRDRP